MPAMTKGFLSPGSALRIVHSSAIRGDHDAREARGRYRATVTLTFGFVAPMYKTRNDMSLLEILELVQHSGRKVNCSSHSCLQARRRLRYGQPRTSIQN